MTSSRWLLLCIVQEVESCSVLLHINEVTSELQTNKINFLFPAINEVNVFIRPPRRRTCYGSAFDHTAVAPERGGLWLLNNIFQFICGPLMGGEGGMARYQCWRLCAADTE